MGYFTDPIDDLMLGWRDFQEQHPDWFDKDHSMWVDFSNQARRAKENNMSKKINAGDTLTVGDLTDDHLGAVIEVGPTDGGITSRFRLDRIECYGTSQVKMLTTEGGAKHADLGERVKVITPPPVVQSDEPTILGQCIRIEGDEDGQIGLVVDPAHVFPILWQTASGAWIRCTWDDVLSRAGNRQIIVSDPPRWPDDTPVVPGRIEVATGPKAGDVFTSIEDMPYGWLAEVTLGNGNSWGYVVRHDDDIITHRWDVADRYGKMFTCDWEGRGTGTLSGGEVRYTLVETVEDHDARVAKDNS